MAPAKLTGRRHELLAQTNITLPADRIAAFYLPRRSFRANLVSAVLWLAGKPLDLAPPQRTTVRIPLGSEANHQTSIRNWYLPRETDLFEVAAHWAGRIFRPAERLRR
jgi:hypothetical protein